VNKNNGAMKDEFVEDMNLVDNETEKIYEEFNSFYEGHLAQ
jgi:hypothetical protein